MIVFIHGVPDTHHLWDPIRARLPHRRTTALSLPGFGCTRPPSFSATKEAYVAFAIGALEQFGEPVDLVGHDWGANLVLRIASVRPDLVRSFVCGGGIIDVEYVWHDVAQQWQTPGVGEEMMALMTPEMMAPMLEASRVPAGIAAETAARVDAEMRSCILDLYRSAVHIGAEWQPELERITRPALILWGADDPFGDVRFGERLAERVRAPLLAFPGCGHWWPVEQPDAAARALERFWEGVGG